MRHHSIQIAQNIAIQLGAPNGIQQIKRFTGASNFATLPDDGDSRGGLSFHFPRTNNSDSKIGTVNRVSVRLDANDTYTVKFGYAHGMKYTEKFTLSGVYCSMLRDMWWKNTGLTLSFASGSVPGLFVS